MGQRGTVDLVLPVGVGFAQGCQSLFLAGIAFINLGNKVAVLVSVHDLNALFLLAPGHTTVVGNARTLSAAAFLGGDDDDTVRTTATIDGGCRGVLEDVEALDVLGVDDGQTIGETFHTLVVHGHTVDHDQRVVAGVQ